jgi:hypothetical protein
MKKIEPKDLDEHEAEAFANVLETRFPWLGSDALFDPRQIPQQVVLLWEELRKAARS